MSRPLDTSLDADRRLVSALRELAPAERLRLADEISAAVRALAEAGIRRRSPQLNATEVEMELAEILLGHDLAAAARRVWLARAGRS